MNFNSHLANVKSQPRGPSPSDMTTERHIYTAVVAIIAHRVVYKSNLSAKGALTGAQLQHLKRPRLSKLKPIWQLFELRIELHFFFYF